MCNGEVNKLLKIFKSKIIFINSKIYNYDGIRNTYGKNYKFEGHCDCEAMGALYNYFGAD